ncbi:hypothetical protein ABG768_011181, partial [Culter alburnus]
HSVWERDREEGCVRRAKGLMWLAHRGAKLLLSIWLSGEYRQGQSSESPPW